MISLDDTVTNKPELGFADTGQESKVVLCHT